MSEENISLIWFHSSRFTIDQNGDLYAHTSVSNETFSRYLDYFDEITIVGRNSNADNLKGMNNIDLNRVHFNSLYGTGNPRHLISHYYRIRAEMRRTIREHDAAMIVLPSIIGLIAADVCRREKIPYFIQVVGCSWDSWWYHGSIAAKFLAPFFFFGTKYAIKRAPFVSYITSSFLQKRYPTRGHEGRGIANVELEPTSDSILHTRLRRISRNNRLNQKRIIGLIGALDLNYKGHEVAFRAIRHAMDNYKMPPVELRLLGRGDLCRWSPLLETLNLTNNVVHDGTLPSGEAVYEWLDKLDLYIQPSLAEAHGRSIIEAMSRALPVLASQIGGISDSLDKPYLFKRADFAGLSSLMHQALTSSDYATTAAIRSFDASKKYLKSENRKRRDSFFTDFFTDSFGVK